MRRALLMQRFFSLFFLLSLPLWARVDQNNDVQLWITEAINIEINDRVILNLANEWRFGDNVSKFHFVYLQGILGTKLTEKIDMGTGYRQIWRLDRKNWRNTYEPLVEFIFHKERKFQFRNRLSYLINERAVNLWQYRGRVRLNAIDWTYNPFVSNEVFVRSREGFMENRSIVGVEVPFTSKGVTDLYFMLRFLKRDRVWTHQYIFGAWFSFFY